MNRFNRFVFRDQVFSIIDQNSRNTDLSLESSLQGFLDEIDHLDHYIQQAKQLCNKSSEYNLTIDESAAIYLYTYEWNENSLQSVLNQALQSGIPIKIERWQEFWYLFINALKKLPTIQRTIWKGLPNDLVLTFDSSSDIVCWNITSGCLSEKMMKSMLHHDSILCSINVLQGKDIRAYTCDNSYEEILLLPGTHLRLNNRLSTVNRVCFEEIRVIDTYIKTNVTSNGHKQGNETTDSQMFSTITFANGDQYQLIHHHDRKQGFGRYTSFSGDIYIGEDADQRANGDGICVFPDGNRFIGTFQRGLKYGHGIRYQTDGTVIVGHFINDTMIEKYLHVHNGIGQYEWKDPIHHDRCYGSYHDQQGNRYIGGMIDSRAIGLGIRIWPDNSRYEGSFQNDKKDGYGIYYYTDRDKYMGQWQKNEMHGEGILKWQSGSMYQGSFINGRRHGQGCVVLPNRQIRRGQWKNDMFMA